MVTVIGPAIQRREAKAQRGEVTCQSSMAFDGKAGTFFGPSAFPADHKVWHERETDREIGITEGPSS